jgi:hypothetical protein
LFISDSQGYSCVGICQSGPTETEQYKPPKFWKTAFIYNGKILASRQIYKEDQEIRNDRPPIYIKETDEEIKSYIGSSFKIVSGGGQEVVKFDDGSSYPVIMDEAFTEKTLRPALHSACNDNIGECLKLWNMGINEEYIDIDGISTFIGITINTDRHMYIFELTPYSIYCRAARFVATNKGVVFNQNFRQGFEAYMIKDNTEARMPLLYDDALFSSYSCVWNSRSVYWSLFLYNNTEITLHGCQGDIYHWKKPER